MARKAKKLSYSFSVELDFQPMKGFGGGFRQSWVTAKGKGFEAGLDSGAGLGNGHLTFWFKRGDGETVFLSAHVAPIMEAGVKALNDGGAR